MYTKKFVFQTSEFFLPLYSTKFSEYINYNFGGKTQLIKAQIKTKEADNCFEISRDFFLDANQIQLGGN